MAYVQISQFGIDKALATVIEEAGIAEAYIREYWRRRGKKVLRADKNLGDYEQQRLYDLSDITGTKWEIKDDRLWQVSGNVYIEIQTLEKTQADKYLIFAGPGFVINVYALREAIAGREMKVGGDRLRSTGVLLPIKELESLAEEVIIL